ncbi:hypothetical protein PR202_ga29205 [Eleusine coracana subsp. coracana]|uniref:Proteasome alpha-type subunits domain-containing protein n=1 Tax=Eleusine coracana subsp. coracana TaxID=191504 RepID=A0AAV5DKR2_ELECO|nr:hypothetical protein PR202_ga29205 [Eleusine coracana subsp. coracana]
MQGPSTESSGGSRRRGRETTPAPYDRRVTVFASDGRLYQVDYAMNAVKLAGITSVGVRGADSVCVVGQLKAKVRTGAWLRGVAAWGSGRKCGMSNFDWSVMVVLLFAFQDKLMDAASSSNMFQITERLGLLTTGMAGDGRALAHQARNQTAEFRSKWGYEMPPDMLAQW